MLGASENKDAGCMVCWLYTPAAIKEGSLGETPARQVHRFKEVQIALREKILMPPRIYIPKPMS